MLQTSPEWIVFTIHYEIDKLIYTGIRYYETIRNQLMTLLGKCIVKVTGANIQTT